MNTLDMLGKPCPIPVIEAKKALLGMQEGNTLEVLVDNDIACQNLQKMAQGLGHGFSASPREDGSFAVVLEVHPTAARGQGGSLVVAIGRECMGAGNDELGAMLMKSYLYSLTELDTPPEHLLLYNGGVKLACQGAPSLEDLRALKARGAQVSACGACLDFYGLTEKLSVGGVTNMYAIAAAMAQAEKLVNL